MLLRIHHAAIICSDYEASKRFYTEILGLTLIAEHYREQRRSYKLDLALPDGSQIELFSFPDPPPRPSYPEARGLRHLAFEVDDVAEWKVRLEEKGIAVEAIRVDEYTGRRFTFFADPDGLPLELYEAGAGRENPSVIPPVIARWHELLSTMDATRLDTLLAEDVVFYSPVVHAPQAGKAITTKYLTAAMGVLFNPSFRYARERYGDRTAVLEFVVEIDGIVVNGVDIMAWNDAGRIVEFKVMIRPLKGIQLIHQRMAEALSRMQ